MSIYLSICLSVCLPIYLSVYLPVYLPVYLSIYLSIDLSVYLSVYRSICLSIYLSVYRSICLSIYVYLCSYLSIHLSVCLSIWLCDYLIICRFIMFLSIFQSLSFCDALSEQALLCVYNPSISYNLQWFNTLQPLNVVLFTCVIFTCILYNIYIYIYINYTYNIYVCDYYLSTFIYTPSKLHLQIAALTAPVQGSIGIHLVRATVRQSHGQPLPCINKLLHCWAARLKQPIASYSYGKRVNMCKHVPFVVIVSLSNMTISLC